VTSRTRANLIVALVALVVLVGACAPAIRAPVAPPRPAPVLLDTADAAAAAELLRMEDMRVLDLELSGRLLASPTPEVRGRTALALGRLRDHAGTPLLLEALADDDVGVRTRAAFALGVLGDTSAAVIAALAGTALQDDHAPAAEAAAALGRTGSTAARPTIDALLLDDSRPADVRREALLAAWRLPRDAGTTAAVLRWLTHPDPETRWRAAYSLARTSGPAALPALLAARTDIDDRVRANVARALRAVIADSAGVRDRALDAALAAAADEHPHVRINALRVLPAYRANDRTLPPLLDALADADANVVIAAAQALAETADIAAAPALRRLAGDANRPDGVRTAALAAWVRLDPAAAAGAAVQWADSSRWLLRMHAARSLTAAPWTVAAAPLGRLARDPHPLVSSDALAALRSVADSVPETRIIFIERLGAQHALVRAAATRGLGRTAGAADLDVLLQAYGRARQDDGREAALAAVEALGRLAEQGVPVAPTFFLRFGADGPPSDPAVHRAIRDRIGAPPAAWGQPRRLPEPQPLAFYAGVIEDLVRPTLAGAGSPRVAITTQHGDIVLELAAADAPLTVHNFLSLIERGYYAGTRWHRVVPNFVIQDGDPRGDGSGGPGYAIRDEINPVRYLRGTLGMALSGPDTGGSQFFITHSPQPHLDGGYTIFGRVIAGFDAVDSVVQEEPILAFRRLR
jgi:cyclophilin family peptidyl-prolyl cis-trans isomerase/HEAT repeat protein